ncbi:MAG: alpha/beta fold hydrolase, partial [Candidatus Poribacteria bacterium]|nr:alpha/beta fold hydrolase [Candidatus Poribacteria bacterium]
MGYAKADLPSLLRMQDGSTVTTTLEWELRRRQLRRLLCDFVLGTFPEKPPAIADAQILKQTCERGTIHEIVQIAFDTEPATSITLEVLRPQGVGTYPAFLTQTNHRPWGLIGLSRGYMACVYPGADVDDQCDQFTNVYPDCTWGRIPRRAWLASRALDYLLTRDDVDKNRVCITGHSRNGKQAMIAAAYDERIKAVVSGSSGSGGATPYRFVSENTFEESVEFTTRMCPDWFTESLRDFVGREHTLPVDLHALTALIAPRSCLLSTALNDGCETTFAVERNYLAAQRVYRLLDAEDQLRTHWRYGAHEITATDVHRYFGWFDRAFGKETEEFPEELLHRFDWQAWRKSNNPAPPEKDAPPQDRIRWLLGDEPPDAKDSADIRYGLEPDHVSRMMVRDRHNEREEPIVGLRLRFGQGVSAHLYYNAGLTLPMPVIIWLHPYSYSTGYTGAYMEGEPIYHVLAARGYAVLCFDQLGFGTRLLEGRDFYKRYPRFSKLGAMARDVRHAVDFLTENDDKLTLPPLDTKNLYVLGYSLGGMVGLFSTALDERIAGLASFSGFTP